MLFFKNTKSIVHIPTGRLKKSTLIRFEPFLFIILSNVRHNKDLPFTLDDAITNLYSYKIYHEDADILKYGHKNSVSPERLSHIDAFVNFDLIRL